MLVFLEIGLHVSKEKIDRPKRGHETRSFAILKVDILLLYSCSSVYS